MPNFYCGLEDLNSGPHVCAERSLLWLSQNLIIVSFASPSLSSFLSSCLLHPLSLPYPFPPFPPSEIKILVYNLEKWLTVTVIPPPPHLLIKQSRLQGTVLINSSILYICIVPLILHSIPQQNHLDCLKTLFIVSKFLK